MGTMASGRQVDWERGWASGSKVYLKATEWLELGSQVEMAEELTGLEDWVVLKSWGLGRPKRPNLTGWQWGRSRMRGGWE